MILESARLPQLRIYTKQLKINIMPKTCSQRGSDLVIVELKNITKKFVELLKKPSTKKKLKQLNNKIIKQVA